MSSLLCTHLACTWLLIGVIWMVQILAYPQFLRVGEAEFVRYHFSHCLRIGLVVAPLLAIEALSAGWLLYQGHRELAFLVSVGLIFAIWLSTALVQAPMHTTLMKGPDATVIRRLILTNWVRTIAWTARGVLVAYVAG